MKTKLKRHKAFSLIEIAVVVIIIAIFISGIISVKEIISKSQLKTAQTTTISSPVGSMKDLALWLETSLDESVTFDSSENVISWNDINPQTINRYRALPFNNGSSTSSFNTYKKNTPELNNLPSMEFVTDRIGFRISSLIKNQYDYSLFIVESHNRLFSSANKGSLLYSSGFYIVYDWAFGSQLVDLSGITSAYMGNELTRSSIHSVISNPTTRTLYYYLYRPKKVMYSFNSGVVGSIVSNVQQNVNLDIGYRPSSSHHFKGYISEIILFNRALKTSDRNLVEDYLMKKYRVEKG